MSSPRSQLGRIPVVTLLALGLLVAAAVFYVRIMRNKERQDTGTAALLAENLRLRQEATRAGERQKKAERERLLAASKSAVRPYSSPPIEAEPNGILERVIRLKSYYAQHPELRIPEMRLLTDEDWMRWTKDADLDTELGNRNALFMLRQTAQQNSGQIVIKALKAFMAANSGELPADMARLVPYLQRPEDAEYVALYQRNDDAHPVPNNAATPEPVWVFKENPQVDPWFHYALYVGQNGELGMTTVNSPAGVVEEAAAKYLKVSGTQPTDASQLIPYLKTSVATPLLEDIFNGMKKSRP